MRDYQRQQAKDQQELSARQEEIYGKFPEFSEIDRKIASASTACADNCSRILLQVRTP